MSLDKKISELVKYAIDKNLIEKSDKYSCINALLYLLKEDSYTECEVDCVPPLNEILEKLCAYAYKKGIIESDSVVYRDLFDTAIMGVFMPRPSEVNKTFYSLYEKDPRLATDYFYALSINSNYIRKDRIEKDLKWKCESEYGDIDITVNLSKPEKDPKAIAAAKNMPQSSYPKCALCKENVGFAGNVSKAARQTLRQIPFDMAGEEWFIQYSPYVYYNEHCIALCGKHTPMKIDSSTFKKLLGFVSTFPHYFIGSNADLPIVGGSILSHDHMQGGRYKFAMESAKCKQKITFKGFEDIDAAILKWPMSVIRIAAEDKDRLVKLATKILDVWQNYEDEDAYVYAYTDGERHNTITPIARKRGDKFELDLVLRNNITTKEYPLGLYHPHDDCHNIKKENIGLIEVMGLAVLPSRLKSEINAMCLAIKSGVDFDTVEEIQKHKSWYLNFKDKYSFTKENTEDIIKAEIGKTFLKVLSYAGVYKDTEEGMVAFMKFIDKVNG